MLLGLRVGLLEMYRIWDPLSLFYLSLYLSLSFFVYFLYILMSAVYTGNLTLAAIYQMSVVSGFNIPYFLPQVTHTQSQYHHSSTLSNILSSLSLPSFPSHNLSKTSLPNRLYASANPLDSNILTSNSSSSNFHT